MSALDAFLRVGETVVLGSHTFTADEIKAFAATFDPQPFHLDEEAARASVFQGLCASGWHVTAMWMRHNIRHREVEEDHPWTGDGPRPVFGPSPGFKDLKWLKPVRPGEEITFTRMVTSHRPLASRPGWNVLTMLCGARDAAGMEVMRYEGAGLFRTG